jgi:peptide/nickel transport system ATP-binding protein
VSGAALEARCLTRVFGGGRSLLGFARPGVHAVQDAELSVAPGETLGVVGESGCGKSTLARMLVGLDRPTAGAVRLFGEDVSDAGMAARARTIQYVFQDPVASLNPRRTIRRILEAPMRRLLDLDPKTRAARLSELLRTVGLSDEHLDRYPHEFSGGQAQRIGIARALAARARIVVLDEPVSSLDVSVQAQVLTLLARLRREMGLTYVFISHDLAVVESVADRVAVMYFGRIVETGPARRLYAAPRHPYTALLLRSAPKPGGSRIEAGTEAAELPDPLDPPPGCAFAARCPRAVDRCRAERPRLDDGATQAACWRPLEPGDAPERREET